jgi:hypothetical protein
MFILRLSAGPDEAGSRRAGHMTIGLFNTAPMKSGAQLAGPSWCVHLIAIPL